MSVRVCTTLAGRDNSAIRIHDMILSGIRIAD